MSKLVKYALVALLVLWVAHNPADAAATGRHLVSVLSGVASGLGAFVSSTAGGAG